MSERAIRFEVRSESGLTGASWKCWTEGRDKNDVYILCRELGGAFKVSLHESGKWHIGFSETFYAEAFSESGPRPDSRLIESWMRPRPIMPGVTLAFRVLTPWSSATNSSRDPDPQIVGIPPAPEGEAVEASVLITETSFHTEGWPGHARMGTKLVDSFGLPNGDSVWVVYRNVPFAWTSVPTGHGTFFEGVDGTALDALGLRAVVVAADSEGFAVLIDVVVKKAG